MRNSFYSFQGKRLIKSNNWKHWTFHFTKDWKQLFFVPKEEKKTSFFHVLQITKKFCENYRFSIHIRTADIINIAIEGNINLFMLDSIVFFQIFWCKIIFVFFNYFICYLEKRKNNFETKRRLVKLFYLNWIIRHLIGGSGLFKTKRSRDNHRCSQTHAIKLGTIFFNLKNY